MKVVVRTSKKKFKFVLIHFLKERNAFDTITALMHVIRDLSIVSLFQISDPLYISKESVCQIDHGFLITSEIVNSIKRVYNQSVQYHYIFPLICLDTIIVE